ncbi:MAG: class I SAM-dependent methyltransferase [DPANN group archaeon]|nr:class I SAM-dependent methyltransferase [DPANN group archaeon]
MGKGSAIISRVLTGDEWVHAEGFRDDHKNHLAYQRAAEAYFSQFEPKAKEVKKELSDALKHYVYAGTPKAKNTAREKLTRLRVDDFSDMDDFEKPLDQYALLYGILKENLKEIERPKVVHIASNYGSLVEYLRNVEGWDAYGLDINKTAAKFATSKGVPVIVGDASKVPFKEGKMDAIFTKDFLDPEYHYSMLLGDSRVKAAINRNFLSDVLKTSYGALKPGGMFISESFSMNVDSVVGGIVKNSRFSEKQVILPDSNDPAVGFYVLRK